MQQSAFRQLSTFWQQLKILEQQVKILEYSSLQCYIVNNSCRRICSCITILCYSGYPDPSFELTGQPLTPGNTVCQCETQNNHFNIFPEYGVQCIMVCVPTELSGKKWFVACHCEGILKNWFLLLTLLSWSCCMISFVWHVQPFSLAENIFGKKLEWRH